MSIYTGFWRGGKEVGLHASTNLIYLQLVDSNDGQVVFAQRVLDMSVSSFRHFLYGHWFLSLLNNDTCDSHLVCVYTVSKMVCIISRPESVDFREVDGVANFGRM